MTDGFMPHGYCLRWDGPLLFVFIIGNLGIATAYFIIPAVLRHFVGKRKDLPYPNMFRLFAAFILLCGITHIAKVCTLYQPAYWIEAIIDLCTAGVSLVTAFLLIPIIPQALKLRSPVELDLANQKLQRLTEELQAALEARTRFLATVSHEVRTPMAGIIGLGELLSEQNLGSRENNETAHAILDSSKRLLQILNDLLDVSKLREGKITIENRNFPIRSVVGEVSQLLRPDADKKQLRVTSLVDESIPEMVCGDELRLRQVLLNLGFNAVKFTANGGVHIIAQLKEQSASALNVRFSIRDTGIGIAPDKQQKIFEPFEQGQITITRVYGGTGLGLTISKNLVELMGGSIGVDSQVGKGSTFWLELPFAYSSRTNNG
jgi:signal transduction histidine kinase